MSSSPRSLTAEEQVPSWRFFLPGGLHICGPLIASCLVFPLGYVCAGKLGHRRNAAFLQNIDPGSLWRHAVHQGSPWQVLTTLRWRSSASQLFTPYYQSRQTLTLLIKIDAGSPPPASSECAHSWENEWMTRYRALHTCHAPTWHCSRLTACHRVPVAFSVWECSIAF